MGRTHSPFYRITVADSRSAATGKFLEHIGQYDPLQNPPVLKLDEASTLKWLKQGARPSDTVKSILHRHGVLEKARLIEKGKVTAESPVKSRSIGAKKPKMHKKAKEVQAAAAKATAETAAKEAAAAKVAAEAAAKEAAVEVAPAAAVEAPATT